MKKAQIREIEVKARITNIHTLRKNIAALGCIFSDPFTQDDHIFFEHGFHMSRFQEGLIGIRIRYQEGKIVFTCKKRTDIPMSAIERELEISDGVAMKDVLEFLGYEEMLRIQKTRMTTTYNDYTICLDIVKGLGTFIEIEKMSDEDSKTVQKELHLFLNHLGVNARQFETLPYDELLLRKRWKIS